MSNMQPQIYHGVYFEVDTNEGTEIVPCDLIGRTMNVHVDALLNYLSGTPEDPEEMCEVKSGWLARMIAPGYLDCTEWTAYDTEWEARKRTDQMYRDDEIEYHSMPAHWASALINGDRSGMSDEDEAELDNYLEVNPEFNMPCDVGPTETGRFGGLLCDVCDYVYFRG